MLFNGKETRIRKDLVLQVKVLLVVSMLSSSNMSVHKHVLSFMHSQHCYNISSSHTGKKIYK